MANLILMLLRSLLTGLRNQAWMQAEIIALRHQLIVLERTQKTNRLVLGRADRCLWVWLSRVSAGWRSALIKRQTHHRTELASERISLVLDMEDPSRPARTD